MTSNICVYPEALKNASAELRKRSEEWFEEADRISSEQYRSNMIYCGKIIGDYAELLEKISSEYEETGRKTVALAEDIYEQKR